MSENDPNDPEDMDLNAMSLDFPELLHASTGTTRRVTITSAAGKPRATSDTGAGPSTRTRKRAPAKVPKDRKDGASEGGDRPARKKQRQESEDSDDDGSCSEHGILVALAKEQLKATHEHIRVTNELHQMMDTKLTHLAEVIKEVRDSQRSCERSIQSMQEVTTTTHLRIESLQRSATTKTIDSTPLYPSLSTIQPSAHQPASHTTTTTKDQPDGGKGPRKIPI